jgi:hypothetical protein
LGLDNIRNTAAAGIDLPDGRKVVLMCNETLNNVGAGHALDGMFCLLAVIDEAALSVTGHGLHVGESAAPGPFSALIDLINDKDGGHIWATAMANQANRDLFEQEIRRKVGPDFDKGLIDDRVRALLYEHLYDDPQGDKELLWENQAFVSLTRSVASSVMRALNKFGRAIEIYEIPPTSRSVTSFIETTQPIKIITDARLTDDW